MAEVGDLSGISTSSDVSLYNVGHGGDEYVLLDVPGCDDSELRFNDEQINEMIEYKFIS